MVSGVFSLRVQHFLYFIAHKAADSFGMSVVTPVRDARGSGGVAGHMHHPEHKGRRTRTSRPICAASQGDAALPVHVVI